MLLALTIWMGTACNSSKVPKSEAVQSNDQYKKIAEEKWDQQPIEYSWNSDSTMVLCMNKAKSKANNPRTALTYFVFDIGNAVVLYESSIDGGSVGWFDTNNLELFTIPGYMPNDKTKDDFIRIYNVKTKESISKKEALSKD